MPRAKKTETIETQAETVTPTEPDLTQAIAGRYYGCIEEIAPAIAAEFWNRLDQAVAVEIVNHRRKCSAPPKFLVGLRDRLAKIEYPDATTRALVSKGGLS